LSATTFSLGKSEEEFSTYLTNGGPPLTVYVQSIVAYSGEMANMPNEVGQAIITQTPAVTGVTLQDSESPFNLSGDTQNNVKMLVSPSELNYLNGVLFGVGGSKISSAPSTAPEDKESAEVAKLKAKSDLDQAKLDVEMMTDSLAAARRDEQIASQFLDDIGRKALYDLSLLSARVTRLDDDHSRFVSERNASGLSPTDKGPLTRSISTTLESLNTAKTGMESLVDGLSDDQRDVHDRRLEIAKLEESKKHLLKVVKDCRTQLSVFEVNAAWRKATLDRDKSGRVATQERLHNNIMDRTCIDSFTRPLRLPNCAVFHQDGSVPQLVPLIPYVPVAALYTFMSALALSECFRLNLLDALGNVHNRSWTTSVRDELNTLIEFQESAHVGTSVNHDTES